MDAGKTNDRGVDGSTHLLAEETLNHIPEDRNKMVQENEDENSEEEKLMPMDGNICSSKEATDVKFISSDSQNGDAKIDMECLKVAFAGMGKEELMKFANDPFWIRMRWSLFALFWILWAAMLAGAITIIIMAPKCPAPPPLEWWEESPLYEVFVPSFKDGNDRNGIGDLKGLMSAKSLDYFGSLGVKGIVISSILKSQNFLSNTALNFTDVDPTFGTLEDFREFTAALKERGLHLVMRFVPNHSSNQHEWFIKSEAVEDPYTNYYVWRDGVINGTGDMTPPNNWKSLHGGSAWEWSDKRKQYYLHQFRADEPDLNFRNPNVTDEFKSILSFWLDQGASGFEFDKIQYLLEEDHLKDESPGDVKGAMHDQYEFYNHAYTACLPGVLNILADWKKVFENRATGIFSVIHSFKDPLLVDYGNNSIVNVVRYTDAFSSLESNISAVDLNSAIEKWHDSGMVPKEIRRYWEFDGLNKSRVASRFSPEVVDGLNIVVMLLPGTPVTYYGEELGMEDSDDPAYFAWAPLSWSNSTNAGFSDVTPWTGLSRNYEIANVEHESQAVDSHLHIYKSLIKARSNPSIMYGAFTSAVFNNGSIFSYTRLKSGNPGYLVAFNPSERDETVNFQQFDQIAEDLSIIIQSSNLQGRMEQPLKSEAVRLPAKGAFVATFVPKQK